MTDRERGPKPTEEELTAIAMIALRLLIRPIETVVDAIHDIQEGKRPPGIIAVTLDFEGMPPAAVANHLLSLGVLGNQLRAYYTQEECAAIAERGVAMASRIATGIEEDITAVMVAGEGTPN